jgi:NAD(P)-dependent dehydrogenase (short-subunit alcohol dehydrogenase family)
MTAPVVLITGALTGIGRATAQAFARAGARSSYPADTKRLAGRSQPNCVALAPRPSSCKPTCVRRMRFATLSTRR